MICVEAAGNRMAIQAARAVVRRAGSAIQPLVIVGASGVGKTHLLHAVGNALGRRDQGLPWPASAPMSLSAS